MVYNISLNPVNTFWLDIFKEWLRTKEELEAWEKNFERTGKVLPSTVRDLIYGICMQDPSVNITRWEKLDDKWTSFLATKGARIEGMHSKWIINRAEKWTHVATNTQILQSIVPWT